VPWKILIPLALPVILVSSLILVYLRSPQPKQDTVVLADLTNLTTDPAFGSSLKAALAADLEQPGFPHILSAAEIRETLRLTGQIGVPTLSQDAAREVCRRTGGKAVIAGSISESGSEFLVDLKATGCSTADVVAEAQARILGKDRVLEALQVAASQLRAKLAESR
jgi:hypothetical protein